MVHVKIVDGEEQIQALVDKKKVIISETSVRSDLHLEDVEGTECLPTATPTPTPIVSTQQPSKAKDKVKPKMIEPEKPLKKKDQIMIDEEVARNLKAQLQAKLEKEGRLARQKEKEANIALITECDDVQAMIDKDKAKGSETRAVRSTKREGEKLESDKSKNQKLDENVEDEVDNDQREAEMKMYTKIIHDDEIAIDAIPLATKPPIIVD
uniref:Uncharacterized protein n=1 Tax=Tanacetum cinerariifolium TaxID=118510 RepID=A0A6L2KCW0_TANCI|nr:hypothetical protein [Tanacetum cinerariifolium]